jgi:acyl-CoA synthetase (NDP forming)
VLAVLMGREGLPQGLAELQRAGIPGYRFPESAARALGAMYRHRRWLERPAPSASPMSIPPASPPSSTARGRSHAKN